LILGHVGQGHSWLLKIEFRFRSITKELCDQLQTGYEACR